MNWNVLADLYATESVYPYCAAPIELIYMYID